MRERERETNSNLFLQKKKRKNCFVAGNATFSLSACQKRGFIFGEQKKSLPRSKYPDHANAGQEKSHLFIFFFVLRCRKMNVNDGGSLK